MKQAIASLFNLPRKALKSLLALDDSAHAIALGVAFGLFIGLTPSVGVQTLMIVGLAAFVRRFCYFNVAAACATTYVSNPVTMVPMYYGWYRLGAVFIPGYDADVNFDPLVTAETWPAWWSAMVTLSTSVGVPMLFGALITAIPGAVLGYFASFKLITKYRQRKQERREQDEPAASNNDSHAESDRPERIDEPHTESTSEVVSSQKSSDHTIQQTLTT